MEDMGLLAGLDPTKEAQMRLTTTPEKASFDLRQRADCDGENLWFYLVSQYKTEQGGC